MSDHEHTTAIGTALEATAHDESGGGSLDKVRDILFGGQMRDLDRRFGRVEDRLTKETSRLDEDFRKRVTAVEAFARSESETLAQRIKAEYDGRSEATADLSRQMQDRHADLERRLGLLDDQIARVQRELRQQILETHQRLVDEIREKVDAVLARVRQEADDLRADKADRATLAALFTEMAMRLTQPAALADEEPRRD